MDMITLVIFLISLVLANSFSKEIPRHLRRSLSNSIPQNQKTSIMEFTEDEDRFWKRELIYSSSLSYKYFEESTTRPEKKHTQEKTSKTKTKESYHGESVVTFHKSKYHVMKMVELMQSVQEYKESVGTNLNKNDSNKTMSVKENSTSSYTSNSTVKEELPTSTSKPTTRNKNVKKSSPSIAKEKSPTAEVSAQTPASSPTYRGNAVEKISASSIKAVKTSTSPKLTKEIYQGTKSATFEVLARTPTSYPSYQGNSIEIKPGSNIKAINLSTSPTGAPTLSKESYQAKSSSGDNPTLTTTPVLITNKPVNNPATVKSLNNEISLLSPPVNITSTITDCKMKPEELQNVMYYKFKKASGDKAFNNQNSPQSKAANWILNTNQTNNNICPNELMQRYALGVLYYSLDGENWDDKNEFLTHEHECEWSNKIRCNDMKEVTEIIIGNNNMSGIIPKEISLLSSLITISLTKATISGIIPTSLSNITTLKTLELSENNMTGKIPKKLYTSLKNLKILNLDNNMFSGKIQSDINQLSNLVSLQLHRNKFDGLIRREFKDLVHLEIGTFHSNSFTGRIPSRMCRLFQPKHGNLNILTADCSGGASAEVICDCCTMCYYKS